MTSRATRFFVIATGNSQQQPRNSFKCFNLRKEMVTHSYVKMLTDTA